MSNQIHTLNDIIDNQITYQNCQNILCFIPKQDLIEIRDILSNPIPLIEDMAQDLNLDLDIDDQGTIYVDQLKFIRLVDSIDIKKFQQSSRNDKLKMIFIGEVHSTSSENGPGLYTLLQLMLFNKIKYRL